AATWTGWIGGARAFVAASASPALTPGDEPYAPVGPFDDDGRLNVEIVVPGWAPVSAMRWLGVTPRPVQAGEQVRVDSSLLERRRAGGRGALPVDAPRELRAVWEQPTLLWAATASPGEAGLLIVDAGAAGFWQVRTENETSVLTPRSSHGVWRDVV